MSFFGKNNKNPAQLSGELLGNHLSENIQKATSESVKNMDLLRDRADKLVNADFNSKGKGTLFEYIETAKYNRSAAIKGLASRAYTTESLGDPHAAADIVIRKNGKTVKKIQAKFSDKASDSVFYQAGGQNGHWGKYRGMDRLIRKDDLYNEKGSMLDEAKRLAGQRANTKSIHADEYNDVHKYLTDETKYGGAASGGTTQEEVTEAFFSPAKYADRFEKQQLMADMKTTSVNMAAGAAVTTGLVSGVTNLFAVLKDDEELGEAISSVCRDVGVSATRGAATGALSTAVRYQGIKKGIKILSDSTSATILSGGMIDGGVALYKYAKGGLTPEELRDELLETTVKSVSTVYFTKAVEMALGKANPFLPIAVYTTASYVVTCTKEIIQNAELKADEFNRMADLYNESTAVLQNFHDQLVFNMQEFTLERKYAMEQFLDTYEYNIATGANYEKALNCLLDFANQLGMEIKHASFDEFKQAMKSDDEFVLK